MADAEIQIVIRAVDSVSAELKGITKRLDEFANNSKKQSAAVSQGFTSTSDSLLALGNTASSVDRIWSNYQNIQLRVENSTERLANAQDRLADSQRILERLQKSGKASADDLADAQRDIERSSRGLTIAQNNLTRTNNAVFGTYLNIATQSVTVIASFNKMKIALQALIVQSYAFIATPLGAALVALGAVVAAVTFVMHEEKEATQAVEEAKNSLAEATAKAADEETRHLDAARKTKEFFL